MSENYSNHRKKVESSDHNNTPITRYDFKEFIRELMVIQNRNKVAKKIEFKLRVDENKISKNKKQIIKEIMAENIVDERLQTLEPLPVLKNLFKYLDLKFFGGELQTNVTVIWNKSAKTKANIKQKANKNGVQNSIQISLSRIIFKSSTRKHLTECLLFAMIRANLMLTKEGYSITDEKHKKLLSKKVKEINKLAKTDINMDTMIKEFNSNSKTRKSERKSNREKLEVIEDIKQLELKEDEIKVEPKD